MCTYCNKPQPKPNEIVVRGMYVYDLPPHLQTKFIYCPMCGRRLGGNNGHI